MNGAHVAGGGLGSLLGVILAALGKKIGLDLTAADAASLGVAGAGVGLAVGHALSKAWSGPGVVPSLKRGLLGPWKAPKPAAVAVSSAATVSPSTGTAVVFQPAAGSATAPTKPKPKPKPKPRAKK